jgi:hypothetical protein
MRRSLNASGGKPVLILAVLLAASLSACGEGTNASSSMSAIAASRTIPATAHPSVVHRAGGRTKRGGTSHVSRAVATPAVSARRGGLAVSRASAKVVQRQPAPGSCHAIGSGLYSEPDPRCTPGALNPDVTARTLDQTICRSGWTTTVRPSESITEREKSASLAAYGDGTSKRGYEYDHLVSLELGGATNDARNLWPEPGASPNPKDAVENALHRLVCDGTMRLAQAQHIIATGWVAWARQHNSSTPAPPQHKSPPTTSSPSGPVGDVNCSDFATHAAAQQWFKAHGGSPSNDVAGLDRDHDGIACESLP